jgi:uncharacterized DUF497 family protein
MGGSTMRHLFAALVVAGAVFTTAAQAEKRIFIISNNADGYGVDRCLATGATCGMMIATAYCQSHDYLQVASFRKIEREEIAGTVPTTNGTSARDEFVAIDCLRKVVDHRVDRPPRSPAVARPLIFGQCFARHCERLAVGPEPNRSTLRGAVDDELRSSP